MAHQRRVRDHRRRGSRALRRWWHCDFSVLQNELRDTSGKIVLVAFDALHYRRRMVILVQSAGFARVCAVCARSFGRDRRQLEQAAPPRGKYGPAALANPRDSR